jgi:glycosyltransferase involved in cell wall biosynthesis
VSRREDVGRPRRSRAAARPRKGPAQRYRSSCSLSGLTVRVLHWYPNFLAGGGCANCVLALATAQGAVGADVWIVSHEHDRPLYGPMTAKNGVRISSWNGLGPIGPRGVRLHLMRRATVHRLKGVAPDIVHIHGEFNPDNWWAPMLWEGPLVLSLQGSFHPVVRQRGAIRKALYMAAARRLLYRKITAFHALSPAERTDIEGVMPTAGTYCVPQGPSPAVSEALATLGSVTTHGNGPVRLMFVGRIDVRTKGLDTLLEAFARATEERSLPRPARLSLVGPDWQDGKSRLVDLARRLGVEHSIEIRDPVTLAEVPTLVRGCDVYVQLSRNEGNPLSLNDALALGKPVIVSDRVGTISYDEIASLPHVQVVPPTVERAAAAIAQTIADLDALQLAARDALFDVRDFLSWDRIARLHLQEYESMVADVASRRF